MEIAVITYTISDDNLRNEFAKHLTDQGFENHPDQSTFTYPMHKVGQIFDITKFSNWIRKWSNGKPWTKTDFISVFYLAKIIDGSKFSAIKTSFFSLK